MAPFAPGQLKILSFFIALQGSLQFFLEHSLDGGQVIVYLWGEGAGAAILLGVILKILIGFGRPYTRA